MPVVHAVERLRDVRGEIEPLLRRHYAEIALHKDRIPLAPDWGRYEVMEAAGGLLICTARLDRALIGYAVFFLQHHIHYLHTFVAMNDVLFLDEPHRRGRTGIRLMQFAEEQLRARRVDRVLWHVKRRHDWSAILGRMGYEEDEVIMGKML